MAERKKILLLTGSFNQTTQMLRIASELTEYDCWFSQMYSDSSFVEFLIKNTNLLNKTIIAEPFRIQAEAYIRAYTQNIDYKAQKNKYDLVLFCSDIMLPKSLLSTKTIWVQEGMIDKPNFLTNIVKSLRLPSSLCLNTSLNGSSNKCDLYCVASDGYKHYLSKMGTNARKIQVTGIPNYDDVAQYRHNDFPYRDYVMVATSDMRETARYDNRAKFIKKCTDIADGRKLLFKLHPNENAQRAIKEIKKYAPADTMIFTNGNTNHMIANCCELITQYSTVVYTGIALGKKVHSYFEIATLNKQAPIQNKGISAKNIAKICKEYLAFEGLKTDFINERKSATIQLNNTIDFIPKHLQSYAK